MSETTVLIRLRDWKNREQVKRGGKKTVTTSFNMEEIRELRPIDEYGHDF